MATYSLHHGEQDRTYYRVCCRGPAGEQVFDLFHNAITNLWVLDVTPLRMALSAPRERPQSTIVQIA